MPNVTGQSKPKFGKLSKVPSAPPAPAAFVSTAEAASRLGVDPATAINMINDGRLGGTRGTQPSRPRWKVHVDSDGYLLDGAGVRVSDQTRPPINVEESLRRLGERLEHLERGDSRTAVSGIGEKRYREAALLLAATLERQREVLELQTRANQQLSESLAEQGRIITGLLVPDSEELLRVTES